MSWSAFEELKSFASSIYGSKKKRKKDWNAPTTKRPKTSGQLSNIEEGRIGGFSSEEESDETCRPLLTKDDKNGHRHPEVKKKRIAADSSDGETKLENLIEDSEDTPHDDKRDGILCTSEPTQHEQLEEILDAMIKDFNSSDEEEKVENPGSLDIETPTPTLTPTRPVIPEQTPKTGSEWLKQVQQHSSSASQDAPCSPELKVDSAKKKHKFKRSGLAEQLQRLINREKSEKSFWAHKQTSKNERNESQDSPSSLDVQILSLQSQYSLHITRCCVLTNPPNVLDIVFDTQTMKQLMLRVGSAVRIHPPWQKLHVPSSPFPVLLCTYYCEVLPTPSGPPPVDADSIPVITWPSSKVGEGATSLVSSPRKSFQPTRLLFEEPQSTKDDAPNTTETMSTNQTQNTKKLLSIAKAIEAQGGCSGGSVSFEALLQRVYRRRVKVARDKAFDSPGDFFLSKTLVTRARSAEDKEEARWVILVQDSSKNVCEIQIPEEYANTEHWVSCIREGVGKACLFEDVRISQRTNRTRSPGLFNVVDSLWKSEDPKVSQEDKSSQILSPDESISQQSTLSSPPNYCYVLTVQDVSRVTPLSDDGYHDLCLLYTLPLQSTIREMFLHNEDTPKRSSVWCRVICSRPSLKISTRLSTNHPSWTGKVLVTDASLHLPPQGSQEKDPAESSRYVSLEVRTSNVLTESVIKTLGEAGSVLYIEDVACTGKDVQGMYADSYTTIKRGMTDPCPEEIVKGDVRVMPLSMYSELLGLRTREFISPLSSVTTQGSLCKVQGAVSGVDEESACCWLECATCGSQDLMERNGLPYYCPLCKADVPEPQTRTNLDVMIKCESWNEGQVVIKLLQSTIEQLLPVSYQDSDQLLLRATKSRIRNGCGNTSNTYFATCSDIRLRGKLHDMALEKGYDIDCVLGKHLGPLYCYVNEHSGSTAKLDEIAVTL